MNDFMQYAGQYWADKNREFEATQPNLGDRVARTINPMTALGAAMGSMDTAAKEGDTKGMGLAALQAWPFFGALKAVGLPAQGLMKAGTQLSPDFLKTLALWGSSVGVSVGSDEVQARSQK